MIRVAGGICLLAFTASVPLFARAAVVINEIAWMGTAASANDEWLELYNPDNAAVDLTSWRLVADSGSPAITLAGSIAAGGYFLLERTSDGSVPSVAADQIYTGALSNSGTTLTLSDAAGNTVNQVVGGANWVNVGGDNATKQTAQRATSGWTTAAATPRAANAGSSSSSSNASTSSAGSSGATSTASASSGSGPVEYVPIPSLRLIAGDDRTVSSGADTAFTAVVYDGKGNRRDDALVTWSFGDGMRKTGASVFHAYESPGEYVAVAHASTPDGGDAFAERIITVQDASVAITAVSSRGITLTNESSRTLDLSLWRLSAGGKEFKIPENTYLLSGRSILFSARVTGLSPSDSALLLYPSGEVAMMYPSLPAVPKPPATSARYEEVQAAESPARYGATEPLMSKRTDNQSYEEGMIAPAAAKNLAAAGAPSVAESAPSPASGMAGAFRSPWFVGFLLVTILAGAAFVLL